MKFTHTHSAGERRGQWGVALLSVVVLVLVGVLVQCLGCGWGERWVWGAALPEGLPLLRVWRSTSNLFAVIAVRANTLESSNSLFYFSHHEGDHLSSRPPARLHFQPSRPLASGPLPPAARNMSSHRRVCTQRHKPSMATFFFIFLQVALMHHTFTKPGTAWQRQRTWAREGEIFFFFFLRGAGDNKHGSVT